MPSGTTIIMRSSNRLSRIIREIIGNFASSLSENSSLEDDEAVFRLNNEDDRDKYIVVR